MNEVPATGCGEAGPGIPALGECHLWHVPVLEHPDWLPILGQEELAAADRFTRARARHVFTTSRAAQRLVGAHYLGLPPGDVVITRDCHRCTAATATPHGRPRFAHGTPAPVDYSVSHTEEHLLVAVTGHGAIGVDIEGRNSLRDVDGLARAALTTGEREHFATLSAEARPRWLLAIWTRKEAAMKLTGLGLRVNPRHLDVRGPLVSVGPMPQWPETPVHLYDLLAPEGHAAALASSTPMTRMRTYELPTSVAASSWPAGRTV